MAVAPITRSQSDGGEVLLDAIRDLDIDYIISSPGSEWPPLWEALARQKRDGAPGPRYMDCGHESIAVGVAAGITQVTGKMQAVLLHAGPGLSQGAMAIGSARDLEIPMLVMSGESSTYGESDFDHGAQWYRNLGVVGGQQRLIEPMVKWAQQVPSPQTLYGSVVRAGELAQRVPKGPVYLSVGMETMLDADTKSPRRMKAPAAPNLRPVQEDIEIAAQAIRSARFPIISVHNAGADPQAFQALVDLAESFAIPVTEAPGAYFGNFPKSSGLYLGSNIKPYLKDCDLVLIVENATPWYPPSNFPEGVPIIAIAQNVLKPHLVYQRLGAAQYLEGHVASTLTLLREALQRGSSESAVIAARRRACKRQHDQWRQGIAAAQEAAASKQTITVPLLVNTLQKILPEDAVYVDETIVHRPLVREQLAWDEPQRYFRSPTGLGQGLGYALGIKLARPKRPVVMLIGDGTFMYNPVIPALAYAQEFEIPVLIVVLNNLKYAVMKELHDRFYPDGTARQEGDYYGVNLQNNHYERTAAIVDGYSCRVENPLDLEQAIREACASVASGKSAILNVIMPEPVAFG